MLQSSDVLPRPNPTTAMLLCEPGLPVVSEVNIRQPPRTMTAEQPATDSLLVRHQISAFPDHQYWEGGQRFGPNTLRARETVFHDLRQRPRLLLDQPYHALHFTVPWPLFDEIADNLGGRLVDVLSHENGGGVLDATIEHLASAMIAQLHAGTHPCRLFCDQLVHTLATYLAVAYGKVVPKDRPVRGGLPPKQLARVQDLLRENLDRNVSLETLARECRLSTRHFSRAFRASTGTSPHRWLVRARLDVAKTLLAARREPLSEIALICGFSDQSHLTRTFTRAFGASPGAWARAQ